ncbi:hypothetical protein LJR034_007810 [Caballeronia sp. LjRoot34]|uniref:hypothetical protein n=1 Tax=Caballeronia sp. LjRoot34 TaxID=3342325 RepID=UPI003ED00BD9
MPEYKQAHTAHFPSISLQRFLGYLEHFWNLSAVKRPKILRYNADVSSHALFPFPYDEDPSLIRIVETK